MLNLWNDTIIFFMVLIYIDLKYSTTKYSKNE